MTPYYQDHAVTLLHGDCLDMARKPGPLRPLNIDGTRIAHSGRRSPHAADGTVHRPSGVVEGGWSGGETFDTTQGRWPANVILTDPIFDGDTLGVVGGGETGPGGSVGGNGLGSHFASSAAIGRHREGLPPLGDEGTYSRFFLIPKASRRDREPLGHTGDRLNTHPTVKPTALMAHLVRLVTPPGGRVLDPFCGSGTTALACEREGFRWVGIEREAEYVAIAEARLNGTQQGLGVPA